MLASDEWHREAVCAQTDPEVFFAKGQHLNAKAVCAGCPVTNECLREALDDEIEFGIWGAMSPPERLALLREERGDDYKWPSLNSTAEGAFCNSGAHLMVGENVLFIVGGGRRCRACKQQRDLEARSRRYAAEREARELAAA